MDIGTLMPDPETKPTQYTLKRQSTHKECAFDIFSSFRPATNVIKSRCGGKRWQGKGNSIEISSPARGKIREIRRYHGQITARQIARRRETVDGEGDTSVCSDLISSRGTRISVSVICKTGRRVARRRRQIIFH
jgi:hypothetical protein